MRSSTVDFGTNVAILGIMNKIQWGSLFGKFGAESAAKLVFEKFNDVFSRTEGGRVKVVKVECFENDNNSSIYEEI